MLLSKSTAVPPPPNSGGLNRLVKQGGDVFLLVPVRGTQHHHAILQKQHWQVDVRREEMDNSCKAGQLKMKLGSNLVIE